MSEELFPIEYGSNSRNSFRPNLTFGASTLLSISASVLAGLVDLARLLQRFEVTSVNANAVYR
jgi:hypothetical protein